VIKVLFANDHLGHRNGVVHGLTTYFLETLPCFEKTRVEPTLCILGRWHPAVTRFAASGLQPLFLARGKWDPGALADIVRLIRSRRIDLLHLSGMKAILLGRIAARLTRRPTVIHLHDLSPLGSWLRFGQRHCVPKPDLALAVSNAVRDFAIRQFRLQPQRVEVLHNGHALERYARACADARFRIRTEFGLAPSARVILVIGKMMTRIKGQHHAIFAMQRIIERCPDAALLLVGDGPDRGLCEQMVNQLGLEQRVRFAGQREDVPDLLAATDVLAMPSSTEGLPYVALEAAAAGRPVVAFDCGGMPDVVLQGQTGILVPPGDQSALATAIVRVLADPALAKRLGEAGRRHAANFTVDRHIARLEELYAAVLETRASNRVRSSAAPNAGDAPQEASRSNLR
jgi:glycosyltransferase involved in cell wall biosynthesis